MRKLLKVSFMILVVMAISYNNVSESTHKANISNLLLDNVDALASDEHGTSGCATYCESALNWRCTILWASGGKTVCDYMRKSGN